MKEDEWAAERAEEVTGRMVPSTALTEVIALASRASIWSAAAAMTAGSTTPVTQSPPSPVTRAAAMQPSAATEAAERLQSAMAGPR